MKNKLQQNAKKSPQNTDAFIPKDPDAIKIMAERASALSEIANINHVDQEFFCYIACKLGDDALYGIPYATIKEVISEVFITKIPGSENYVAGVMNYRGMLIGVIDLQIFLFNTPKNSQRKDHIIIVSEQNMRVGLLVNTIIGSDKYDTNTLKPPLMNTTMNNNSFFLGLHQSKITILNIKNICKKLEEN